MKRLLPAVLAAFSLASAAPAEPALWIVRSPHAEVVLFGSLHMLPAGLTWRPPSLDAALARASDLWFELPINQATDVAAIEIMRRKGGEPPGRTLWDELGESRSGRVAAAATRFGLPRQALTRMRPWMADLTLSLAADEQEGALSRVGVEATLQNGAPAAAKRHALETVRQQVGFLADGSTAEQLASMDETLREIDMEPDLYGRTLRAWLAGDVTALEAEDLEPLRSRAPGAYRRLIVERNRRWAEAVSQMLHRGGVQVVVVGAGHLIGPDGLPALLRARGLTVEGP